MFITYAEYSNVFDTPDETEFDQILPIAETTIDYICGNKITVLGFDNLGATTQSAIKNAAIYEVNCIYNGGGVYVLNNESSGNVKVDDFSYSDGGGDSSKGIKYINGIPFSTISEMFLQPTNLLYPPCNELFGADDYD